MCFARHENHWILYDDDVRTVWDTLPDIVKTDGIMFLYECIRHQSSSVMSAHMRQERTSDNEDGMSAHWMSVSDTTADVRVVHL